MQSGTLGARDERSKLRRQGIECQNIVAQKGWESQVWPRDPVKFNSLHLCPKAGMTRVGFLDARRRVHPDAGLAVRVRVSVRHGLQDRHPDLPRGRAGEGEAEPQNQKGKRRRPPRAAPPLLFVYVTNVGFFSQCSSEFHQMKWFCCDQTEGIVGC